MSKPLPSRTRKRLNVQGLTCISDQELAPVAAWWRTAYLGCAVLAAAGTALASPTILWIVMPLAALGALFPVHPLDLVYNYGIRYLTGTGPLPRRTPQTRFACGVGALWLVATALAFQSGQLTLGYALGGSLTGLAALAGTTDICVPSMIYNAIFLRPKAG